MESIKVSENADGVTYTVSIINDNSHGDRTFIVAKEDIEKLSLLYKA